MVCCPSPGANESEVAVELLGAEELCCPSGAAEGVGASGNAVAAISVRCGGGDRGKSPLSCATPGIRASRQIKPVMITRIHLQRRRHPFANPDKPLMQPQRLWPQIFSVFGRLQNRFLKTAANEQSAVSSFSEGYGAKAAKWPHPAVNAFTANLKVLRLVRLGFMTTDLSKLALSLLRFIGNDECEMPIYFGAQPGRAGILRKDDEPRRCGTLPRRYPNLTSPSYVAAPACP